MIIRKTTKLNIFSIKALMLIAFVVLFVPVFVGATSSDNLNGWAWSENIGLISFNSTNDHDPVTAGVQPSGINYGVNRNGDDTLTGYAWSDNIGWIQFGSLSGFPSGNGTTAANAQVVGSALTGWARAVTPAASGATGWDGWISLTGTSPNYGVTISGAAYTGYAWGSDVVGWLSFDAAGANGVTSNGIKSITAPSPITWSSSANISWTITPSNSDSCTITQTAGPVMGMFTAVNNTGTSGSQSSSPLSTAGVYTFTMTCVSGFTQGASVTVSPQAPGFTLGSAENLRIQFPTNAPADSEIKSIVNGAATAFGGFTGTVAMSISSSPTLPGGAIITYSFNGGAFSANPTANIAYGTSATFKARISKPITSAGGPYTITLRGTSSGVSDVYKSFTITPSSFNPSFDEF